MSDMNRSIHLVRIPTGLEVQGYYHTGKDGYVYYRLVDQKAQTTRTGYRTAKAVLADLREGNYDLTTGEWVGGDQRAAVQTFEIRRGGLT